MKRLKQRKLPDGWEWKQIKDISNNFDEKRIPIKESEREKRRGEYPYCGANGIIDYVDDFLFDGEHILLAEDGGYWDSGENSAYIMNGRFWVNNHAHILKAYEGSCTNQYLTRILNYLDLRKYVTGTTRGKLTQEAMNRIEIPLPPIKIQNKIVSILQNAESISKKRAQSISLIQQLLQSVFLEMFGDPVKNPMGWEKKSLEELIADRSGIICGPFGSQLKIGEYVEEGIPVIGIDNIDVNKFILAKPKFITTEKASQLKSFEVKPRDVLVTRTGTVGRSCVLPDDVGRAVIGPNLLKISFDRQTMLPEVFSAAISYFPSISQKIKRVSPGATVAVLNTKNLKALKIAVPPMTLQASFVNRLSVIRRLTDAQRRSDLEIDSINGALFNNAFKGELAT